MTLPRDQGNPAAAKRPPPPVVDRAVKTVADDAAGRPHAWSTPGASPSARATAPPEPAWAADMDAAVTARVAVLVKAVLRFDALACEFPGGFLGPRNHAARQVAERVKLLSQSLRLSILLERASEETIEAGAQLLMSMRQLHLLGRTRRLHLSHQTVLRVGLGLAEQIVKGLRDLRPAPEPPNP